MNTKIFWIFGTILSLLFASGSVGAVESRLPAFPGAEGFGADTPGGRGGKVYRVTTLADYRPGKEPSIEGSLRAAVEAEGPRIVVFRVSGTIPLKTTLRIRNPYLTLAGQTAPGGGICLKNYGTSIGTHNVIIRYLRFRPGDEMGKEMDALGVVGGSYNVIIDHCSTSWGNDEVLSISGAGITDVTVQWCIISESLNRSSHSKGAHGFGSLIRCNGNVTFHHNLYALHRSRSPRPGTYGEGSILFDFRNNLLHKGGRGYTAEDPVRMNFVANYHPTTPFKATPTCEFFSDGNIGQIGGGKGRTEPFEAASVLTTHAEVAHDAILESCGAILPKRDLVDARVIAHVRAGTGELIDSQAEVGGWATLESAPAPTDTDADGMPDEWEINHQLNPNDPSDHREDADGDGYTNIEEYLNTTDPQKPAKSAVLKNP
jgi:pectate lyase